MNANRQLCRVAMFAAVLVLSACTSQIDPGEFQRSDDKSERLVFFPDGKLLQCFLIKDSLIEIARVGSYKIDGLVLILKGFLPSSIPEERAKDSTYHLDGAGNNRFRVPYGHYVEDDLVLFTRVGDISPEVEERLKRVEQ